jgi:hypothetical protein
MTLSRNIEGGNGRAASGGLGGVPDVELRTEAVTLPYVYGEGAGWMDINVGCVEPRCAQRGGGGLQPLSTRPCLPGESERLVVESAWPQFTSECQRFGHPPRLDK